MPTTTTPFPPPVLSQQEMDRIKSEAQMAASAFLSTIRNLQSKITDMDNDRLAKFEQIQKAIEDINVRVTAIEEGKKYRKNRSLQIMT